MKKTGKQAVITLQAEGAFTLMEVMIAIGILAISLVAIFSVQASSITAAGRVRNLTAATLLAQSKMIDIERELMEEGFSDFAEEINGNFEEEGWPEFRWSATVAKVKIPIPTSMPGEDNSGFASLMSGYSSMITDLIGNALRECNLTIEWDEGNATHEMTLATHFIEFGRASMLESSPAGLGANQKGGKANTPGVVGPGSTGVGSTLQTTGQKSPFVK